MSSFTYVKERRLGVNEVSEAVDPLWRSGPALRELRAAGVETQALSSAVCAVFFHRTPARVTRDPCSRAEI